MVSSVSFSAEVEVLLTGRIAEGLHGLWAMERPEL